MKKPKKPLYTFVATKKPFTMDLEEGIVTGWGDGACYHRFHKRVLVRKGDTFSYSKKRGFILNGKALKIVTYPGKMLVYRIGWAAKKIRLAVFPDGKCWIAADTRSYNVSQGNTAIEAIRNLIATLKYEDEMQKKDEAKGHQVVRWHVERTPGTKAEMLDMERKAMKKGLLLESVEWR